MTDISPVFHARQGLFHTIWRGQLRSIPFNDRKEMQFIYKDLGPRQIGDIVEVTLTNPSNVRLMDDLNFANYKKGVKHIYTGGVVRQTAVRLHIPTLGHWHLAVDTQGLQSSGSFGATVKVIEG